MKRINFLSFLLISCFVSLAVTQVPQQMNYQGYLTDNAGNPVTGNLIVRFTIYDAPSGGTNLWNEEHSNVAIIEGVFRVMLGSINPLNLPFDKQYWLGIRAGNDLEMVPRITLTSAAYSLNSQTAESVKDSTVSTASIQDGAVTLSKLEPDMMVRVFEGSCSNVNSYLITGLDGNLHKIYKIYFQGIIHTGESWLLLQPNEDAVLNNYRGYLVYGGDASGGQWSNVGLLMGRTWSTENASSFEISLYAESGKVRHSMGHGMINLPTAQLLGEETYGFWGNAGDNITSLKFSLTNFSGVSAGTFSGTFTVYAVNPR